MICLPCSRRDIFRSGYSKNKGYCAKLIILKGNDVNLLKAKGFLMHGTAEQRFSARIDLLQDIAIPMVLCISCLVVRYLSTYLAFHFVAETFSIVVALAIYIVVLSSNVLTKNTFLLIIASGFAWAGVIDIFHVMYFKGMFTLQNSGPNVGATFWLGAQLLQAGSVVLGIFCIHQTIRNAQIQLGFLLYTSIWIAATVLSLFPIAFDVTQGLTPFKIGTEIFIIMLLFVGIYELYKERNLIDKTCFQYLALGLGFLILAESFFCIYSDVTDIRNFIGHLCKILSYWYVFRALVVVALETPFHQLSRAVSSYDLIPFPAVLVDKRGEIIQANLSSCDFLQSQREAIAGHSLHELFHNKEVNQYDCAACHPIFTKVEVSTIDILVAKDYWLESSASLIADQHDDILWLVIMRDVSHRKILEREKQNLVQELSHRVAELALINRISSLLFTPNLNIGSFIQQAISFVPLSFARPDNIYIELNSDFGDFSYPEKPSIISYTVAQDNIHFEEKIYGQVKLYSVRDALPQEDRVLVQERLTVFVHQLGLGLQSLIYHEDKQRISRFYELLLKVNASHKTFFSEQEIYAEYFNLFANEIRFKAVFQANIVLDNSVRIDIEHGLNAEEREAWETFFNRGEFWKSSKAHALREGQVVDLDPQNDEFLQVPLQSHMVMSSKHLNKGYLIPVHHEGHLYAIMALLDQRLPEPKNQWLEVLQAICERMRANLVLLLQQERTKIAENFADTFEKSSLELFYSSPMPIQIISKSDKKTILVNPAFEHWTGFSMDDILQQPDWDNMFFGNFLQEIYQRHLGVDPQQNPKAPYTSERECSLLSKSGVPLIARYSAISLATELTLGWVDITDIKHAERSLQEQQNHFKAILEQTYTGIYVRTEKAFVYTNPRFREIVGYSEEELANMTTLDLLPPEDKLLAKEIRSLWAEVFAKQKGLSKTLPFVCKNTKVIQVGLHGTPMKWDGEDALLVMVQDITEREETKNKIALYTEQLEIMVHDAFKALAYMVELRDPYTAGHERRVGLIARAIAEKLGLSEKVCANMELIGLVHDIGKITVPAEILTKPTALSPAERSIVRSHALAGYEILKNIHFEGASVAQIILQHHERLDGSGYPNALRGNQILLEARILMVADVLESMSSHRPYRPALGLSKALSEIKNGRGTLFDPAVVDAVVELIEQDHYPLP